MDDYQVRLRRVDGVVVGYDVCYDDEAGREVICHTFTEPWDAEACAYRMSEGYRRYVREGKAQADKMLSIELERALEWSNALERQNRDYFGMVKAAESVVNAAVNYVKADDADERLSDGDLYAHLEEAVRQYRHHALHPLCPHCAAPQSPFTWQCPSCGRDLSEHGQTAGEQRGE